jgi:Uri superfamily endonuclease
VMPRWHVDYIGKTMRHLGVVDADDDDQAVDKAAKLFNIAEERRSKLVVEPIVPRDKADKT